MNSHIFKPDMPPPNMSAGALAWMRSNLFSNWFNTLLTLLAVYLVYLTVPPLLQWALLDANWVGTTQADCTKEGACWVFVQQRFGQFMYGYYPSELRWRVDLTLWLAVLGAAPLFIKRMPRKPVYGLVFPRFVSTFAPVCIEGRRGIVRGRAGSRILAFLLFWIRWGREQCHDGPLYTQART